jgi:exopolysaccharide production protein ExoQ
MSNDPYLTARPALQGGRSIWLIFLFLAAVFFLGEHNFSYARNGSDMYNPSEEDLISSATEGSLIRRVAFLSLGVFAVVSLVRRKSDGPFHVNGLLGWLLIAFASWAFLSLIWADDPSQTSKKLVAFGIFCLGATAVARRFTLREIILWTCFSTALFVLIGASAEIILGGFRPFTSGYRFSGTLHPNIQGINCALLVLSALAAATTESRRNRLYWFCAAFGFFFLILTASRTAFAGTLVASGVYLASICSKRAKIAMAYALSIVFCLVMLVLVNGLIPGLKSAATLGRDDSNDASFNGRTGIWDAVGRYAVRHPIVGYGYGGFWTPTRMSLISEDEHFGIPNSHLAYLDYFLTLGAVGMVTYTLLLFTGIKRAFRFLHLSRNSAFAFCAAFLVFCALDGLMESATMETSLPMFLITVVLAQLAFVRPALSLGANGRTA